MSKRPSRLEDALSFPVQFEGLLDARDQSNLAERVEEALHGSLFDLQALARQLDDLVLSNSRKLPSGGAEQLISDSATPFRVVYEAGILGFAQLLTAQAAAKRAPDRVQDVAKSAPLFPYLVELSKGERTNSELALVASEAQETISRKLKKLRFHGITAFRRDGRITTNYLTPLGRSLAGVGFCEIPSSHSPPSVMSESALMTKVLVSGLEAKLKLPKHLRAQQILGTPQDECVPSRIANVP